MLKRSNSLPQLQMGENLMEELGINKDIRVDHLNLQEVMLLQTQNARNAQVKFCNLNQMYPLLNVFLCRCFFWANSFFLFFFKFYSHYCYFYITIQTIQIHIAATNYMSMFYLFFGIEKRRANIVTFG